ncbi:MAG: ABC transporter substrate-binding protein [Gammaproteobacteria bacterium]|nr:ABC transporter substrate-binding protein [Gammaproteobacteria bacterium]
MATPVTLGFKAFDIHELACHAIAEEAGLYERSGLAPQLADIRSSVGNQLPDDGLQVACGAALAAWLSGADARVVFVASERPMFWLYADESVSDWDALRGATVAGYPEAAPPAMFFGRILQDHGLDRADVAITPAPSDTDRLAMLFDGKAQGALVSSATPGTELASQGLWPLCFFGDELQVATTGLAATAEFCAREPQLVRELCACFADALDIIHGDPVRAAAILRASELPGDATGEWSAGILARCYTRDGRISSAAAENGAAVLAHALQIENPPPVSELYDLSYLV